MIMIMIGIFYFLIVFIYCWFVKDSSRKGGENKMKIKHSIDSSTSNFKLQAFKTFNKSIQNSTINNNQQQSHKF
jgi:hypothetical protein